MPRIRSIHPDACDDELVAQITPAAFRTWVLLWTHLDDKGRGVDSAKLWAGKLYSLNDHMTADKVERDLAELAACGLLIRYEVDGKKYLTCKPESWARWQKPQHPTPSKLPPPDTSGVAHEGFASGSSGSGGERSCYGVEGESEGEAPVATSRPSVQRALALASEPTLRKEPA